MAADLRPEPRLSSECRPPWPETATPGDLREEEVKGRRRVKWCGWNGRGRLFIFFFQEFIFRSI
jgi:hypothetical protein